MRKEKTVSQALAYFFSLGAPGKSKERYAKLRRDWGYNLIYDSDVQAVSKRALRPLKPGPVCITHLQVKIVKIREWESGLSPFRKHGKTLATQARGFLQLPFFLFHEIFLAAILDILAEGGLTRSIWNTMRTPEKPSERRQRFQKTPTGLSAKYM